MYGLRLELQRWLHCVCLLLITLCSLLSLAVKDENGVKSAAFLSPMFEMSPGSVVNRYYNKIEFPRGHVGLKSFNAEVVDEDGTPVPLQETYLHHWVVARYYQRKDAQEKESNNLFSPESDRNHKKDYMFARNSGNCQGNVLGQYFGLGSETRKTSTHVPGNYAIEIGNPEEIPDGYEERWMLNVHAIDTLGVVDKLGCTECRCDLYNVSIDEYGRPLRPDYNGGLYCCYDQMQCRLKRGFETVSRKLYLRYTVKWVDWDTSLVPVKIYIFDVTDGWKESKDQHSCRIEYEVEACSRDSDAADCSDSKKTSFLMPKGGYVVYGVAHQHSGGIGSALYGEDGRMICSSIPAYGVGKEPGNEAGYIVGMSTCYPKPGTVKISDGERLVLVSNYSSAKNHTGVMGLFYILVADQLPKSENHLGSEDSPTRINFHSATPAVLALGVMLLAVASAVGLRSRARSGEGYQPIMTLRPS